MMKGKAEFWGMVFGAKQEDKPMPHDDAVRSAIVKEFQGGR